MAAKETFSVPAQRSRVRDVTIVENSRLLPPDFDITLSSSFDKFCTNIDLFHKWWPIYYSFQCMLIKLY